MSKIWTAKAYLLDQGKIKEITRGRMSNVNKEFLAEAAASGVQFSDFKATSAVTAAGNTVVRNSAPRSNGSQIDNFTEEFVRYAGPHGGISKANDVWAVKVEGKTIPTPGGHGGLKEVCQNCHLSLAGHTCATPVIVFKGRNVAVTIERR